MIIFKKVVIIGTGLIGGAVGQAIRKNHLATQVIGLSRKLQNAQWAKKIGAIDKFSSDLNVVKDADLVILATPVDTIIDLALKIAPKLKDDCLVIDVGSTKEKIVKTLSLKISNFIGCHPLAGSEKSGIKNMTGDIFKKSICLITPLASTKRLKLNKIKQLWQKIGARVIILTPQEHDRILSFTSHLVHAVAFALISTVPEKFLNFSSGGLKDSTRIAGSNSLLWSQIFLSNRQNLLNSISAFQAKLNSLKLVLKNQDQKQLFKILTSAKKKRESL